MGNPASIDAIFRVAFSIESLDIREEYLKQACGNDQALYDRVVALLRTQDERPEFMESPPSGVAATMDFAPIAERPGTYISSYKLVEEIGEGGMGSVFMALQKRPVRRTVALKVIKPGMDSKQVVSRFEAERQTLALMDHPNIATVLDGGTTESGRPYFVMELVKGIPITEYCDGHRLTNRERLELFRDVCSAVHHAHQKGIIHRDLKPSNVLVTQLDSKPLPKVIDFGIAKATSGHLMDESLVTGFSQLVGTPMYMSPEQAELTANNVDTRSDVYSLGVLLYELLTGVTPFDQDRMSSASFDEVRKIVREEEPPRPSTRLSTLDAALETVAEQRHTDARSLSHEVSGELDWIVMKALEKDRTRRYESSSDFAKDIQRYLDDAPVEACPPSTRYRLRKFARRNKVAITFASVLLLSLLVGIGGTTWMALKAKEKQELAEIAGANEEKQRKEAELQRDRASIEQKRAERQEKIARENFERARDAVDEYLTRVSEEELLDTPGLQPLREDLLELALKYYEEFAAERASDSALQVELAEAYLRIGAIKKQIGPQEESREAIQKAIAICTKLVESNPNEARFLDLLAKGHDRLGRILVLTYDEKQISCRKAIEIWKSLVAEDPDNVVYQQSLANSCNRLGSILQSFPRKRNEALGFHRKALEIQKRLVEAHPDVADYRDDLASSYVNQGILHGAMRRPDEALSSWQEARNIWEKLLDDEPSVLKYRKGLAAALGNLSNLHRKSQRWDEAIASQRAAFDIFRELADENPRVLIYQENLAMAYSNLGALQMAIGEQDAALQSHEEALNIRKKLADACPDILNYRVGLAKCYHNCAVAQIKVGKLIEAIASFEKAIELKEHRVSEGRAVLATHIALAKEYMSLGNLQRNAGSVEEALASYQEAIDIWQKLVDKNPDVPVFPLSLVRLLLLVGKLQTDLSSEEEATASFEKVVEILAEVPEGKRSLVHWGNLGQALYRLERWHEAREALESGNRLRNETEPTITGGPRWWYLTMALAQLGEKDKARAYYRQLVAELKAQEKPAELHRQLRAEAAELLGITEPKEDNPQDEDETNSKTRDEAEIQT